MAGRMAIQFAPALVIRSLFDTLTAKAQLTPELWALVALLVGVALARVVILVSATWAHATMSYLYSSLLNVNVLGYLTHRPGALTPTFPVGDMISRMGQDIPQVTVYLNFLLLEVIGAFTALVAIYLMARIDPWVTLVALVPLVAAALITHRATARLEQLQQVKRIGGWRGQHLSGRGFWCGPGGASGRRGRHATRHLEQLNGTRRRCCAARAHVSRCDHGAR